MPAIVEGQETKVCSKCRKEKPTGEFCKNRSTKDGFSYQCKQCKIEYELRCKDEIAKRQKEYRAMCSRVLADKAKNYARSNPEKIRAKNTITYAMTSGKILKPDFCMLCGGDKKIQAHHLNYEYPLLIVWVCAGCHRKIHNGTINMSEIASDTRTASREEQKGMENGNNN